MSDYDDLRLARLGGVLDDVEAKAAAPAKKKVKPRPPWLDDPEDVRDRGADEAEEDDPEDRADHGADEATEDESDDKPPRRRRGQKKALPAHPKPPASFKAKRQLPKQNTAKARRKQTVTSPRGHLARVQHASRGTNVSMRTLPAPAGFKAKSVEAGRPTVWGPQKQHVDITRARVATTGSDSRVNAAAGRRSNGRAKPYGRGQAGGNGVTRGRGDVRAARVAPENLRGGRGGPKVRHSGEMGEGAAWGRSGSAAIPHKPGNIKSLYDFSPDELRSAMDVAAKAIRGVLRDHEDAHSEG